MKKFQLNIAYDLFSDAGLLDLSDGQDVTDIFKNDFMAPLTAVIVKAEGARIWAGKPSPVVEFEFQCARQDDAVIERIRPVHRRLLIGIHIDRADHRSAAQREPGIALAAVGRVVIVHRQVGRGPH